MESDWGRKQFTAYLGENTALWEPHDATVLMRERGFPGPVLIDTGTADQFGDLLKTEALAEAIAPAGNRDPAAAAGLRPFLFLRLDLHGGSRDLPCRGALRGRRMSGKGIEAVVFDIGNVLIEWQPERYYDATIGEDRRRAMFAEVDLHGMNDRVDLGEGFREVIYDGGGVSRSGGPRSGTGTTTGSSWRRRPSPIRCSSCGRCGRRASRSSR
jgi:hypothetical protein